MGRKKSRSARSEYKYESEEVETESNDSSSFAEKLLSTMNIDISKKDDKLVEEEAVEVSDTVSESEIKHPHLHHIHKSISKVFHGDSSSKEEDSLDGASSTSKSRSVSASEGKNTSEKSLDRLSDNESVKERKAEEESEEQAHTQARAHEDGNDTEEAASAPGKKRNRRKEKLAERERERARIVQEAQAEAKTIPDKRAIELKGMGMMISKAGLQEHEVQPDGHCLFHSLSDQLKQRYDIDVSVEELRTILANFIRAHPDDFVPYLIEDETGDVIDIDKYTNDLQNTPLWGGELEIMAASRNYKVPIQVYFASQPSLTINGEEFSGRAPLTIAYYQEKFGLGAHYNSLRDATKEVPVTE